MFVIFVMVHVPVPQAAIENQVLPHMEGELVGVVRSEIELTLLGARAGGKVLTA